MSDSWIALENGKCSPEAQQGVTEQAVTQLSGSTPPLFAPPSQPLIHPDPSQGRAHGGY